MSCAPLASDELPARADLCLAPPLVSALAAPGAQLKQQRLPLEIQQRQGGRGGCAQFAETAQEQRARPTPWYGRPRVHGPVAPALLHLPQAACRNRLLASMAFAWPLVPLPSRGPAVSATQDAIAAFADVPETAREELQACRGWAGVRFRLALALLLPTCRDFPQALK